MARWTTANVLQTAGDAKRLWVFSFSGDRPKLAREETKLPNEPLTTRYISKDWQTLYQPRLNIGWLPADKVFLRVIQLPPADTHEETVSMLELQLEKLSPLPVAQVVWTFDLLPKNTLGTQTAIVVIAARNLVEEYLGKLEGQGYLADKLEIPFIDQLLATKVEADGVWIYPGQGSDEHSCLVVWWYGGVLQNVSLLHLPPAEERGAFVLEQLAQMSWAGELEGWLTAPPKRFLVADTTLAETWKPLLDTPDQPVFVVSPVPAAELAAMTARRAARDGRVSLVPPEFTARYRQQFVDRIWMRTVGAAIVCYLLFVVIYIAYLQFADMRVSAVETEARNLQGAYTNALKLKAQVQIMEDQLNLQFAALNCYRAVAQTLPEGITVDSMTLQRGKTFVVYGTGESGSQSAVNDFYAKMRDFSVDGQKLFSRVDVPHIGTKQGTTLSWNFTCELKRAESE